ncbi:MAG TPA: type III secretion system chaperone [Ramlibacter sp.]|nr:type III secretion system chaperone [Ramlibacter sp.]
MSTTNDLLRTLGQALGIPELSFDAEGLRSLAVGDALVVNLQHDAGTSEIVLFAVAATLPPNPPAETLLRLLRANRFWRGTGGATLSLDEHAPPRAILARRVAAAAVTPAQFVTLFEGFVDHLNDWHALLGEQDTSFDPMSTMALRMANFA